MSEKEIIKALECHTSQGCADCPYDKGLEAFCIRQLIKDALDLINRQKNIIKTNDEIISELEEQQELEDEIADGGASCHLCLKVHTDKAIKEFADKLKAMLVKYDMYGTLYISNDIDNLVKEMVAGSGTENG